MKKRILTVHPEIEGKLYPGMCFAIANSFNQIVLIEYIKNPEFDKYQKQLEKFKIKHSYLGTVIRGFVNFKGQFVY